MTAIFLFGFGLIAFFVQLVLYSIQNKYSVYAVFAAAAILYSGIVAAALYCFLLRKRSNPALCTLAGLFGLVPPIGTFFTLLLLIRIRNDTGAEALVYNGYAYTLCAARTHADSYSFDFIDGSEVSKAETLNKKQIKQKLNSLKKSAKSPEGYYKYAEALATYCGSRKISEAVSYMTKAAKSDYPPALFNLGYFSEIGYGMRRDEKKAIDFYRRAKEHGDVDAAVRLGIASIKGGNPQEGVKVFTERAENNELCSMFDLAVCYERGVGVAKDMSKAVDLYARACELFAAQQRIFALAAKLIDAADIDDVYGKLKAYKLPKEFGFMLDGIAAVRAHRALDAANSFLNAVKCRGKWEGIARCFVGTLYVDNGALTIDRIHGVQYVQSANKLTPLAKDILESFPKKLVAETPPISRKDPLPKANMATDKAAPAATDSTNAQVADSAATAPAAKKEPSANKALDKEKTPDAKKPSTNKKPDAKKEIAATKKSAKTKKQPDKEKPSQKGDAKKAPVAPSAPNDVFDPNF